MIVNEDSEQRLKKEKKMKPMPTPESGVAEAKLSTYSQDQKDIEANDNCRRSVRIRKAGCTRKSFENSIWEYGKYKIPLNISDNVYKCSRTGIKEFEEGEMENIDGKINLIDNDPISIITCLHGM